MENIRKTDSKKRILKAFIEILNTDGFNKMTVSKITSLAHINRGTFYLNYIDKFDLLEEIEQEIFTKIKTIKIKTILLEKETIDIIFSDEKILAVISYLQSNAALITALINSDLKNSIQEQLANLLKNIFTENNANINNPKIAQPYASNIIFGSISTIFITWIKNNMQESPEELLNIINSYRKLTPIDIFS